VDHFLETVWLRDNHALGFFPTGDTCTENLDIGVTECFCLTGREWTQSSGRSSAVKDQHLVFVLGQNDAALFLGGAIGK
jgi:hypothetical protein